LIASVCVLSGVLTCVLCGCGGGREGFGSPAPASTRSSGQAARGAEEGIEAFGNEAEGGDRRAILAAEQSYFFAAASKRYALACSRLATSVRSSLSKFADSRPGANCSDVLPAMLAPQAYAALRQQLNGAIRKVRRKGDRAFVVFHAPGARLYQLPLVNEQNRWKVRLLFASILAPSL
jgi:hypothetical protein